MACLSADIAVSEPGVLEEEDDDVTYRRVADACGRGVPDDDENYRRRRKV